MLKRGILRREWCLICAALSLALSCGTMAYVPSQGPLEIKKEYIPDLVIRGTPTVADEQGDKTPVIVYSHLGLELQTDYRAVTEHMINGLRQQLDLHGQRAPGPAKTIGLKVTYLHSENRLGAAWISELGFQATLGNGVSVNKTTSDVNGTAPQVGMNNCVLVGIVQLLNDRAVKEYLGSPSAGAADPPQSAAPASDTGGEHGP